MWFWWFMFVFNLLIPGALIIFGRSMWKKCPQKINWAYGYRTSRSMKNMDTWKFAHDYCGKIWWKSGWIMLITSAVLQIPFYRSSEDVIGSLGVILCVVQLVIMIMSIFLTERALKNNFFSDGTRREIRLK